MILSNSCPSYISSSHTSPAPRKRRHIEEAEESSYPHVTGMQLDNPTDYASVPLPKHLIERIHREKNAIPALQNKSTAEFLDYLLDNLSLRQIVENEGIYFFN
ncbi:hypothetical protein K7432_016292 [Basidiobolus ranarum]|uniref:Uncharacterized protein n=1 Tax=Basidiobolus ranarum TaxID=34480 RepID=A0ABR2WF28_9FUNG